MYQCVVSDEQNDFIYILFQDEVQSSITEAQKADRVLLQRLFPDVKVDNKMVSSTPLNEPGLVG